MTRERCLNKSGGYYCDREYEHTGRCSLGTPCSAPDPRDRASEEQYQADEAEERRLERDVVEAALVFNRGDDDTLDAVRALDNACKALVAFRKEKGT